MLVEWITKDSHFTFLKTLCIRGWQRTRMWAISGDWSLNPWPWEQQHVVKPAVGEKNTLRDICVARHECSVWQMASHQPFLPSRKSISNHGNQWRPRTRPITKWEGRGKGDSNKCKQEGLSAWFGLETSKNWLFIVLYCLEPIYEP